MDEVIFKYSTQQAIDDGVLVYPYPERWPWLLITSSVHDKCSADESRTYDQKLVPLIMDCIMAVQANKKAEPPIVLEHTVAGTVWIMPNEQGGMTIMSPEDY